MKNIRYTIKGIVDVPAEDPAYITECLEFIQQYGEAEIENVEIIETEGVTRGFGEGVHKGRKLIKSDAESVSLQKALVLRDLVKGNTEAAIRDLLAKNPRPDDHEVHALAEKLDMQPDDLEEKIYAMLSERISKAVDEVDLDETLAIMRVLGISDKDVDSRQLQMGINVEFEHSDLIGKDKAKAAKIALAHLKEMPDYYTKLKAMEKREVEKAIALRKLGSASQLPSSPAATHAAHSNLGNVKPPSPLPRETKSQRQAAIRSAGYAKPKLFKGEDLLEKAIALRDLIKFRMPQGMGRDEYYCPKCKSVHRKDSEIGKEHRKAMEQGQIDAWKFIIGGETKPKDSGLHAYKYGEGLGNPLGIAERAHKAGRLNQVAPGDLKAAKEKLQKLFDDGALAKDEVDDARKLIAAIDLQLKLSGMKK